MLLALFYNYCVHVVPPKTSLSTEQDMIRTVCSGTFALADRGFLFSSLRGARGGTNLLTTVDALENCSLPQMSSLLCPVCVFTPR